MYGLDLNDILANVLSDLVVALLLHVGAKVWKWIWEWYARKKGQRLLR